MRRFLLPSTFLFAGLFGCKAGEQTPAKPNIEPTNAVADEPSLAEKIERETDADKRLRIEVALRRAPEVYTPRLEIDVKDGVAYLRGSVEDERARRTAIELAARTTGIERVVDELEVFPFDAPDYRQRVYDAFD